MAAGRRARLRSPSCPRHVGRRDQRRRDRRRREDFGAPRRTLARAVEPCVRAQDIYRTDAMQLAGSGRPLARLVHPRVAASPAGEPARQRAARDGFSKRAVPFADVQAALDSGALDSLAVTAMSYRSGMSVTFCQARAGIELWQRSQRVGVPATHRRAASARVERDSVRVPAGADRRRIFRRRRACGRSRRPSPALHLGADRILVDRRRRAARVRPRRAASATPPSMAQIGGQVLASIFTDALGTDLEKVRLVNVAVRQIPLGTARGEPGPAARRRALPVLTPSIVLEDIALAHVDELPRRSACCCAASADASGRRGAAVVPAVRAGLLQGADRRSAAPTRARNAPRSRRCSPAR